MRLITSAITPTMRYQRIGCGTSQTIRAKTSTARMAPSSVRMINGRPSCPISARDGIERLQQGLDHEVDEQGDHHRQRGHPEQAGK